MGENATNIYIFTNVHQGQTVSYIYITLYAIYNRQICITKLMIIRIECFYRSLGVWNSSKLCGFPVFKNQQPSIYFSHSQFSFPNFYRK